MENFDYCNPTRIVFGPGVHSQVGELVKPHADRVLLHYGGGSIKRSGLYDAIAASLKAAGVAYVELGGVVPNPRLSLVREGIALCRRERIGFVLAVGGGSVIDSAKAIAMGAPHKGDVWKLFAEGTPVEQALKVGTVLTIPAAGSESSPNTVITNEEEGLKLGYGAQVLRPVFSILDPELCLTLPPEQLANGVSDMMSHIFERYFSNTPHVDLTDALCEATLRTIMKHARRLRASPQDADAWAQIVFSGYVAHKGLLGLGRQQDWACHGMEHELSALYDVAHGAGLAVLTPAWMEYVFRDNVPLFVQFAVNVMGVEGGFREPEAVAQEGIRRLRGFYKEMGLPSTLEGLGIGADKLELMAKKATKIAFGAQRPLGGLRKLGWQDVLAIYRVC
ncbi:MAG: iron-containing alcohol dehydrogenase [Lentisphaerae bacterium]|jgi:alcohol dehydrogenase YqhD (iron-dependent ADH family)|nr:iron-containing alcohol dehydrogenase [Lentisphaerota bacterium]